MFELLDFAKAGRGPAGAAPRLVGAAGAKLLRCGFHTCASPNSTGALFTRPPDVGNCPICFEPLFGCVDAVELLPRLEALGAEDEDDWSRCPPDRWAMRKDGPDVKNVIHLRCEHMFHVGCIAGHIRASRANGVPLRCPVCRSPDGISREVLEDLGMSQRAEPAVLQEADEREAQVPAAARDALREQIRAAREQAAQAAQAARVARAVAEVAQAEVERVEVVRAARRRLRASAAQVPTAPPLPPDEALLRLSDELRGDQSRLAIDMVEAAAQLAQKWADTVADALRDGTDAEAAVRRVAQYAEQAVYWEGVAQDETGDRALAARGRAVTELRIATEAAERVTALLL